MQIAKIHAEFICSVYILHHSAVAILDLHSDHIVLSPEQEITDIRAQYKISPLYAQTNYIFDR